MAPPKKGFMHSVGIVFGKDRHPSKNSGCPLSVLLLLAKVAAVVAMVFALAGCPGGDHTARYHCGLALHDLRGWTGDESYRMDFNNVWRDAPPGYHDNCRFVNNIGHVVWATVNIYSEDKRFG